jgi:excisionase family DNA binding protein
MLKRKEVMPMSDELTSREVAAILGISERAVLYAVERGELSATPIQKGKKRFWRFTRTDVEAYRRSIQNEPGTHIEG